MEQPDLFGGRGTPDGLVYVSDFIEEGAETQLLASIRTLPLTEARYKEYTAKRRTVNFGLQYDFRDNELRPSVPIPELLFPLRAKVADWLSIAAQDFAHALVTEYRPGTALGWHRDVPEFEVVVGVSLGSPCRMRFRPYPPRAGRDRNAFELYLEPRSAYVMHGDARWRWQHAIPPTAALRYSITFRTMAARVQKQRVSGKS